MEINIILNKNLNSNFDEKKYNINLPIFTGPLDLLLFLIKSQEINIYDIPISLITKQFLDYIDYLNKLNIEISSEFILMASELIYIKSRSLLPVKNEENDEILESIEDPRKELVEKLLEYKKYCQAIEQFKPETKDIPAFYGNKNILFDLNNEGEWKPLTILDIVKNFSYFLSKTNKEEKTFVVKSHKFTVEDKLNFIKNKIEEKNEIFFIELVESEYFDRIEYICIFLAILELVKTGLIKLYQNTLFGEIKISKTK
jgi:segregation and condensation protein A